MQPPTVPTYTNQQVAMATTVAAAVALCFWLIYRYNETLLLGVAGIIIAIAVRPLVRRLRRLGISQGLGVAIVYVLLLAGLLAFVLFGVPLIAAQATTIGERIQELYTEFYNLLLTTENFFLRRLLRTLPETLSAAEPAPAAPDALGSVNEGFVLASSVLQGVLKVLATLAMAFFWTVESERIKQVLLLLVPITKRAGARETVNEVEEMVGNFTVGQGILMLIIGVAQGIVYYAVGLPYAFLLAVIAGITEAVPIIGPLLGTVPAVLVALTLSPTTAFIVLAAALVIQQVENTFLVPRIMGNAVGAAPVPTMLAFIAFSSLFGFLGALITVPVTAALQLIAQRTIFSPTTAEDKLVDGGRTKVSLVRYELRDLIDDVRGQIRSKEDVATASKDQVEDSIEAIAVDLDSVLAKYDQETT